jgi:hypothetical protein
MKKAPLKREHVCVLFLLTSRKRKASIFETTKQKKKKSQGKLVEMLNHSPVTCYLETNLVLVGFLFCQLSREVYKESG